MTETITQLDADDVWRAVGAIDPVAAVAEDLVQRTVDAGEGDKRATGRLVSWPARQAGVHKHSHVALELADGTVTCVAPAATLHLVRSAALVALAARELLVPGALTVAVVGTSAPALPQLAVIFQHLRDISHVALWPAGGDLAPIDASELLEKLELNGVLASVGTSLAETLFGANLVIVVGDGGLDGSRSGQLAGGAVVVNATGRDLPSDLVDRMGDVYVDDLGLLEVNRHRHVVAAHLATRARVPAGTRATRIAADLGLLLTDRVRRRPAAGPTALVELLGVTELSVALAHRIFRAARRAGLGRPAIPRSSA